MAAAQADAHTLLQLLDLAVLSFPSSTLGGCARCGGAPAESAGDAAHYSQVKQLRLVAVSSLSGHPRVQVSAWGAHELGVGGSLPSAEDACRAVLSGLASCSGQPGWRVQQPAGTGGWSGVHTPALDAAPGERLNNQGAPSCSTGRTRRWVLLRGEHSTFAAGPWPLQGPLACQGRPGGCLKASTTCSARASSGLVLVCPGAGKAVARVLVPLDTHAAAGPARVPRRAAACRPLRKGPPVVPRTHAGQLRRSLCARPGPSGRPMHPSARPGGRTAPADPVPRAARRHAARPGFSGLELR